MTPTPAEQVMVRAFRYKATPGPDSRPAVLLTDPEEGR